MEGSKSHHVIGEGLLEFVGCSAKGGARDVFGIRVKDLEVCGEGGGRKAEVIRA